MRPSTPDSETSSAIAGPACRPRPLGEYRDVYDQRRDNPAVTSKSQRRYPSESMSSR